MTTFLAVVREARRRTIEIASGFLTILFSCRSKTRYLSFSFQTAKIGWGIGISARQACKA